MRQDGTQAYYFEKDELVALATRVGFVVVECEYIVRQYANRKQKSARHRIWVHAKFQKP